MREDAAQRRSERVSRGSGEVSSSERSRRHGARESRTENRPSICSPSSRLQTRSNSSDGEVSATPSRERLSLRKRRSVLSHAKTEYTAVNGHVTPPDHSYMNGDCDSDVTFSPRVHRSHARFPRTSTSNTRTSGELQNTSDGEKSFLASPAVIEAQILKEKSIKHPTVTEDNEEESKARTFSPRVHRSRNRFPRTTPTHTSKGTGSQGVTSPLSTALNFCFNDEKEDVKKKPISVETTEDEETDGLITEVESVKEDVNTTTVTADKVDKKLKDDVTSDEDTETRPPRRRSGRLVTRAAGSSDVNKQPSKLPASRPKVSHRTTPQPPADDAGSGTDKSESSSDSEESVRPMQLRRSARRSQPESQADSKSQTASDHEDAMEAELDLSQWVSPRRSTRIVFQRSRIETGPPAGLSSTSQPEPDAAKTSMATAKDEYADIKKEAEEEIVDDEAPDSPYEAPRLRKRRRSSTADSRLGDVETSSSASTVAAVSVQEPPAKRRRCGNRQQGTFDKPEAISEDDEGNEEDSEEASEISSVPPSNQQTPTRPKKPANRSKRKEDDDNRTEYYEFQRLYVNSLLRREPVCIECEKMGPVEEVFTCTGGCQMAFHQSCAEKRLHRLQTNSHVSSRAKKDVSVGEQKEDQEDKSCEPTVVIEWRSETFKCPECLLKRRHCFMCKEEQSDDSAPLIRCHVASCAHLYHEACLRAMTFTRQENRRLTCPAHLCHACAIDNPASRSVRLGRMMRCIRCPVAYHAGDFCIPAGSTELSGNLIICPNHYEAALMKKYKTINTLWCLICSKGGSLICCEKCPASFHTDCIDVDGESVPEKFVCDDCLQGRNPRYGEIVWAKVGHFRWWPCEVLHKRNAPRNIIRLTHYPGQFAVHFFGSDEYCWIHRGRVFSFEDGDYEELNSADEESSNRLKRWYAKGIKKAVRAFNAWTEDREEKETKQDSKKPYPYRYIRNNYPIGNVKLHRPGELHELPRCDCDPNKTSGGGPCSSDSECLNRMLMYECHPSICRAGDRCENQRFVKRQYPVQEIFRTTDNRGWGLLAGQAIKKGEFVNEYVGDLIDEEEAMRRLQQAHENNVTNYYMLTLDRTRIIDAGPKGNLSRFMNHSCNPSVETQKWLVNGDFRIGLFAARDLKKGEELTFNYNFQSLGDEQCVCRCGAESCKGFLGDPTQAQAEKQQQELEEPSTKQKHQSNQPKQKNQQSKEKQNQQTKQKAKSKLPETQSKSKVPETQLKAKPQQQQPSQNKSKSQQLQSKPKQEVQPKKNQNKKSQPQQQKSQETAPQKVLKHKFKVKHRVMQKKQKDPTSKEKRSGSRSKLSLHDSCASLQSSCSSSDADNSGPADTPSSKIHTPSSHKQRVKKHQTNTLTTNNICFRCGEGGETMCCDADRCPKAYHLACLGVDKVPDGQWFCPWHHCDFCGRAASVLCRDCTTSYCELHAASDAVAPLVRLEDSGLVLCADHLPDTESAVSGEASACTTTTSEKTLVCATSEDSSTRDTSAKESVAPTKSEKESSVCGSSATCTSFDKAPACSTSEKESTVCDTTDKESSESDAAEKKSSTCGATEESSACDQTEELSTCSAIGKEPSACGTSGIELLGSDTTEIESPASGGADMESSACGTSEKASPSVPSKESSQPDKGKENTTPPRQSASASQSVVA